MRLFLSWDAATDSWGLWPQLVPSFMAWGRDHTGRFPARPFLVVVGHQQVARKKHNLSYSA
jgi:hypothetical protein